MDQPCARHGPALEARKTALAFIPDRRPIFAFDLHDLIIAVMSSGYPLHQMSVFFPRRDRDSDLPLLLRVTRADCTFVATLSAPGPFV